MLTLFISSVMLFLNSLLRYSVVTKFSLILLIEELISLRSLLYKVSNFSVYLLSIAVTLSEISLTY